MGRRLTAAILAFCLTAAPARADDGVSPLNGDYWIGYPMNLARVVAQPVHWNQDDWIAAGFVAAGITGVFFLDKTIKHAAQDARSDTSDAIADVFRPFGESKIMAGVGIATWGLGEATSNVRLQRVGLNSVQSLLIAQTITEGVKRVSGRRRPLNQDDPFDFSGDFDADGDSLWSGHAATAFAVASVWAEEYKRDKPWVPYVAYGLAAGTAWSRVNDNKHWASDVVLGALFGTTTGIVVSKYSPFRDKGMIVMPKVNSEEVGFALTTRF